MEVVNYTIIDIKTSVQCQTVHQTVYLVSAYCVSSGMQLNGQSNVRPPSHKWPELDDNNPYPRMAFYSK